jgi:hypothetical protein
VLTLDELEDGLQRLVGSFDPGRLDGAEAARVLARFSAIKRLAAAGETLVAGRVAESNAWRVHGDRSPADFLARTTGESVGRSRGVLDTATRLDQLPETEAALRAGKLSATQAEIISSAGPAAEALLVPVAAGMPVAKLKEAAARLRQSGEDADARYERIKQSRYLRTWSDVDGASCGSWKLTPDAGGVVLAALQPFVENAYRQAKKTGTVESSEAVAADGFTGLCAAVKSGSVEKPAGSRWPKGETVLLVNLESLRRGSVEAGETCEIAGVGPVPVSVARELFPGSLLKIVIKDGVDIRTVVHTKRRATAEMLTGLFVRDGGTLKCVKPSCGRPAVQIDHTADWALTFETQLDQLAGLCWHDHDLKTNHGHTYTHGQHGWEWHYPDGTIEYEHPPPQQE